MVSVAKLVNKVKEVKVIMGTNIMVHNLKVFSFSAIGHYSKFSLG